MKLNFFVKDDAKNMTYKDFRTKISKKGADKNDLQKVFSSIIKFPFNKMLDEQIIIDVMDGCALAKSANDQNAPIFLIKAKSKQNNRLDLSELDAVISYLYRENTNNRSGVIKPQNIDNLKITTIIDYLTKFFNEAGIL